MDIFYFSVRSSLGMRLGKENGYRIVILASYKFQEGGGTIPQNSYIPSRTYEQLPISVQWLARSFSTHGEIITPFSLSFSSWGLQE